jgi:hypothetical protein
MTFYWHSYGELVPVATLRGRHVKGDVLEQDGIVDAKWTMRWVWRFGGPCAEEIEAQLYLRESLLEASDNVAQEKKHYRKIYIFFSKCL